MSLFARAKPDVCVRARYIVRFFEDPSAANTVVTNPIHKMFSMISASPDNDADICAAPTYLKTAIMYSDAYHNENTLDSAFQAGVRLSFDG